jgi:hypothetical protein
MSNLELRNIGGGNLATEKNSMTACGIDEEKPCSG